MRTVVNRFRSLIGMPKPLNCITAGTSADRRGLPNSPTYSPKWARLVTDEVPIGLSSLIVPANGTDTPVAFAARVKRKSAANWTFITRFPIEISNPIWKPIDWKT